MDYSNNNISPTEEYNKDSIFIWIDILGFSKKLENPIEYNSLRKILTNFRNYFKFPDIHQSVFSDGILLEIPCGVHRMNSERVNKIFKEIAKKQLLFMIEERVVIRGGISSGAPISEDDYENRIYVSNGLAKAYNTESKESSWPIIGITESTFKDLQKLTNNHNVDAFKLKVTYNESGKKIYFLHFAEGLVDNADKMSLSGNSLTLTNLIEDKINRCEQGDDRTRSKYFWILKYLKETIGTSIPDKYKEHIL